MHAFIVAATEGPSGALVLHLTGYEADIILNDLNNKIYAPPLPGFGKNVLLLSFCHQLVFIYVSLNVKHRFLTPIFICWFEKQVIKFSTLFSLIFLRQLPDFLSHGLFVITFNNHIYLFVFFIVIYSLTSY